MMNAWHLAWAFRWRAQPRCLQDRRYTVARIADRVNANSVTLFIGHRYQVLPAHLSYGMAGPLPEVWP